MTFDVFCEFCCCHIDILIPQIIDESLMTFNADFPFGCFHAVTEAAKEGLKQITECNEWQQAAGLEQCAVEFDIHFDPLLQFLC